MAAARRCFPHFSYVLRLPAHPSAQPLPSSQALGRRVTAPAAASYCSNCLSSSPHNAAAAVQSPFSRCSLVHSVRPPSYVKAGHRQSKAQTTGCFSACSPSGRRAAFHPFLGKVLSHARRSLTIVQSRFPVSRVSQAPSSSKSPEVTAAEAAAPADNPTSSHCSITSEQQLLARMDALKTHLLAANWQDYLTFVLNSAFWEAEMHRLEIEVKGLLRDLRRLFDLMAQASDVRDHINQILELGSRSTGFAGTGLNAAEKVENFEDHVQAAVAEYDRLLKEYPEYCSLVDDCLGSGLAMMRQKQRFIFSALHRFFY